MPRRAAEEIGVRSRTIYVLLGCDCQGGEGPSSPGACRGAADLRGKVVNSPHEAGRS